MQNAIPKLDVAFRYDARQAVGDDRDARLIYMRQKDRKLISAEASNQVRFP
jgi:hypothetical protein